MPFRGLETTGKITREHLQRDLPYKMYAETEYVGDASLPEPTEPTGVEILLSGDVLAGDAVGLDSSGRGAKANNAFPTVGIALTNGTIGDYIYIVVNGYYESSRYVLTAGELVWLTTGASTAINITATKPTATSGNYIQVLGRAIGETRLLIEVCEAIIIQ